MNDYQLRHAFKVKVLARHAKDPETRIVEELGLRHGLARIDIAVVNGIVHGFELKSDKDNLKRLPHQSQIYGSILDKVTLVVGNRHANEATKLVPEWWGITIATVGRLGGFQFIHIRRPSANPSPDPLSVSSLLWRDEALTLLDELGAAELVRHKPRALVYAQLAEVADLASIQERVRRQLKCRTTWRSDPQRMLRDDLSRPEAVSRHFLALDQFVDTGCRYIGLQN